MDLLCPADVPSTGCWRGVAEVTAAIQPNFGALAEMLAVVAQGDTAVLFAEERGQVRASGTSYHMRWVQLFTFRKDKIIRLRSLAAHLPG